MSSVPDIHALIVTADHSLVAAFSDISKDLGIEVQTSSSTGDADQHLRHEKYDALLLDFDTVANGEPILDFLRNTPSNKSAVVLAVATGVARKELAFRSGVNFVFERPLQLPELRRTLSAAYQLMQVERRRYFRCTVNIPVRLTTHSGENIECSTMNVSSQGMAVTAAVSLKSATNVEVAFVLPGGGPIRAKGLIVWDDKHGKSGMQFQCSTAEMQRDLDRWLDRQFAASLSASAPSTQTSG